MVSTRFNPTVNGNLHLGHLYTLLVNERFAHDRGGRFHVRFDDTDQAVMLEMAHPEKAEVIAKSQKEIISWLGIKAETWTYQSEILERVHEEMQPYSDYLFPDPHPHYLP